MEFYRYDICYFVKSEFWSQYFNVQSKEESKISEYKSSAPKSINNFESSIKNIATSNM